MGREWAAAPRSRAKIRSESMSEFGLIQALSNLPASRLLLRMKRRRGHNFAEPDRAKHRRHLDDDDGARGDDSARARSTSLTATSSRLMSRAAAAAATTTAATTSGCRR